MRRSPNKREDRGASLLMVAAAMTLLIGAAAVAVDLAALRLDIRADRLASDAAVTAGANSINPFSGSEADAACEVAWGYLLINLEDEDSASAVPPDCTVFSGTCDATPRVATASADPYNFSITHPVPDDHPLMGDQDINDDVDGVPCQRLGVTVERTRPHTFARVLGFDTGVTEVASVGRIRPDVGEGEVVPLVVLEPYGCDALIAGGQGKVTVTHFEDSPGFIVVDSSGTGADCGASSPYTMEVQAEGQERWIRAIPVPGPGGAASAILSYARSGKTSADPTINTDPSRSFNPDDLETAIVGADPSDPPESYFQLYPEPGPKSQRVTRAPIDHRYNCQTDYPDYMGLDIVDCTDPPATYIDNLVTDWGGPVGVQPFGITNRWTDTHSCNLGPGDVVEVSGDWWVDCHPRFVINGATVRFLDGDVVIDGDIDLRSDGVLEVNPLSSNDHKVFVRDGELLKVAQASITLRHTFVLLENGAIDLVGGDGGLVWTSPVAGNFEDLALWSESDLQHELGGQSGNSLTGTFFTPYADPFILKGQSGQLQTDAQFLTRRLEVTGFTEVLMKPDPETSTLIPIRGVSLIR